MRKYNKMYLQYKYNVNTINIADLHDNKGIPKVIEKL